MAEPGGSLLLQPLSHLYGVLSRTYHALYDHRWRRSQTLPLPVISVGNLVAGGTGKTPVVLALARELVERGRHPAILTRGYRGTRRGMVRAGIWESGNPARAEETGDEPLLLSRDLPSVPVVVDPDRVRGGRSLLGRAPVDVLLLDDGMQHRKLARDLNLVLVDADSPIGNGRLLPAGPLREPPEALRRADHLVLTGGTAGKPVSPKVLELLERHAPGVPRTRAWTVPDRVTPLAAGPGSESTGPVGHDAVAVAGLARPERFRKLLEELGARVVTTHFFPDHHAFTEDEVRRLETEARFRNALLLTTAKDAVRLEHLVASAAPWMVVGIRTEAEGGWGALLDRHREALEGS